MGDFFFSSSSKQSQWEQFLPASLVPSNAMTPTVRSIRHPSETTIIDDLANLNSNDKQQIFMMAVLNHNSDLLKQYLASKAAHKSKSKLACVQMDLLTNAHHQQLKILKYKKNGSKQCLYFNHWVDDLCLVLATNNKLCQIFQDWKNIHHFKVHMCNKNQALFTLANSYVINYYKSLIKHDGIYSFGDCTLTLLQSQCANITTQDLHHCHHEFTSLRITGQETVTKFLQWFTFGWMQAEQFSNSYANKQLLDFLLSALSGALSQQSMDQCLIYETQCGSRMILAFADIEHTFISINEWTAQEVKHTSHIFASANASSLPIHLPIPIKFDLLQPCQSWDLADSWQDLIKVHASHLIDPIPPPPDLSMTFPRSSAMNAGS